MPDTYRCKNDFWGLFFLPPHSSGLVKLHLRKKKNSVLKLDIASILSHYAFVYPTVKSPAHTCIHLRIAPILHIVTGKVTPYYYEFDMHILVNSGHFYVFFLALISSCYLRWLLDTWTKSWTRSCKEGNWIH